MSKKNKTYSIGIDYGTNSVRALVVDTANGNEVGTAVVNYPSGKDGILLDKKDHNLARQSPKDYVVCLEEVIKKALAIARKNVGLKNEEIIGLGVDTTGSTPLPVDENNQPLAFNKKFKNNLNAQAWLWKDHTSFEEAHLITEKASQMRPHYLKKCGGTYSSEWFWAKIWHCLRVDEEVFNAAYAWIECQDFIPAVLCGVKKPEQIVRGVCAAGHKAMYNASWGGLPDEEFLSALDPRLVKVRKPIESKAVPINHKAGMLCDEWAKKLGLRAGIPVAVGAFDAHLGGVGAGIRKGTLVKIIGTSTCDIMVAPLSDNVPDIPGVCGIVEESVLPGYYGIEAGQSAVGDIFRWFVTEVCHSDDKLQVELTKEAAKLKPGETGLIALDWNNGNRTILVDPNLTGLLMGTTLHTNRAHIYRALIEGTAFGALTIINRLEEYGVKIERIVCCGGIAEKNSLFMQIYADVLNRPMMVSRSAQTCALGSAIAGAVVGGAYQSCEDAISAMTGVKKQIYKPIPENVVVYQKLYAIYKELHDAFGIKGTRSYDFYQIMKNLLAIKNEVLGK